MSDPAALEHLQVQIQRNQAVAERLERLPDPVIQSLHRLQEWQRLRLDQTYADLRDSARYRPACEFFLDELYGGRDFRERDRQLSRVVPVMRRFLPGHLLMAVGDAMQLQAVSLEFDLDLAEILVECQALTQPDYARAYRVHQVWAARCEQMDQVRALGVVLDETVHKPMVHRLVQMMQVPAALAGFGALQSFLRRGLDAFAKMDGADHFLETIDSRERQALAAMQAGSDWPFEPWIGHWPET